MSSKPSTQHIADYFRSAFGSECKIVARTPGRIEFIGNHTDYNGGLVAGAAIDRFVWVAGGHRNDRTLRFASGLSARHATGSLDALHRFEGDDSWANYPLGALSILISRGLQAETGFELAVNADLPAGAGLSSSAALELASTLVIAGLYGMHVPREELVQIGRAVENDFLGFPSGPLDQSVCAHGRENHLVFIDCRTLGVELVPIPPECRIRIFNTGVSHSLVDSLYSTRHDECRRALHLLRETHPGLEFLTDAEENFLDDLPENTPATVVNRARHVIRENARVREAKEALLRNDLERTGELLRESHESSRTLFENSCPELDTLADLLNEHPHVHGARLTGGGFGGAVMALTSGGFGDDHARHIQESYKEIYGHGSEVLSCTVTSGAQVLDLRTRQHSG